jgi:TPR repeat protein
MYYNGQGVAKNKIMAFVWLDMASANGNKLAQNKLGYMYEKGEVKGTKDEVKATAEYLKSAMQNYNIAQLNLAMKYNASHKEEHHKIAAFWYEKSANNGNTQAMNNLANMYYHGQGVRQNFKAAFDLYLKASTLGDHIAQFNLSMMYFNGLHVKQSDKDTLTWLTLSAMAGYPLAQVRLGDFYREGFSVVKQDYQKALYWYYEAANQNDGKGMYSIGVCYYYGYGIAKDNKKARYWMDKAIENKYPGAKSFIERKKI